MGLSYLVDASMCCYFYLTVFSVTLTRPLGYAVVFANGQSIFLEVSAVCTYKPGFVTVIWLRNRSGSLLPPQ